MDSFWDGVVRARNEKYGFTYVMSSEMRSFLKRAYGNAGMMMAKIATDSGHYGLRSAWSLLMWETLTSMSFVTCNKRGEKAIMDWLEDQVDWDRAPKRLNRAFSIETVTEAVEFIKEVISRKDRDIVGEAGAFWSYPVLDEEEDVSDTVDNKDDCECFIRKTGLVNDSRLQDVFTRYDFRSNLLKLMLRDGTGILLAEVTEVLKYAMSVRLLEIHVEEVYAIEEYWLHVCRNQVWEQLIEFHLERVKPTIADLKILKRSVVESRILDSFIDMKDHRLVDEYMKS